jgi:glycine cleavage system pyridoxal-binding protein P
MDGAGGGRSPADRASWARAPTSTTFRRRSGKIVGRGEFYSAYTPYQPEASQGTLQVLYEYQSMMAGLTAVAVSNASLYDGASALAEALLMAVRANRKSKSKRILVPRALHPLYRRTAHAIVHNQGIELVELPYDPTGGHTPAEALAPYAGQDFAALVIAQPNFLRGAGGSGRADRLGAPATGRWRWRWSTPRRWRS